MALTATSTTSTSSSSPLLTSTTCDTHAQRAGQN
jgi:hypothetical protein